ncbi:MAG: S8/S53 family peptidase [Candidatus Aminicenantes bacterium]|nr:S8/S53 family peptidase [Candidatus Aminicenantes bacterium]
MIKITKRARVIKIQFVVCIFFIGVLNGTAFRVRGSDSPWLQSLHEEGRKLFYQTIRQEIKTHPQRNQLTEAEIKKIMEAEIRYKRLYGLIMNIFYQKDEPMYKALLEDGSEKAKSYFRQRYLKLAKFSAHNFINCFFSTDAATYYMREYFPEYKGMDSVDLVIRSIGYNAKIILPPRIKVNKSLSPEFDKQWALDAAKFRAAHKITKGKGVKIAILDTGIDESHPVFRNTVWGKHFSLVGREGPPWLATAPVVDWGGHGTLISSVVARYAPQAQITMYKFADGVTQNNPAYQLLMQSMIAASIYKAVHDGNDVIMISSSGASLDVDYLREACQYAYDNNRIVISGNLYHRWLREGNNLNYPGQYDTVLSVTAVEKRDDGSLRYWDICAPDATTTVAVPNGIFGAFPSYFEEKDTYIPSISAAIPVVASLVALTISQYPRLGTEAPGEYCDTIKQLIIESASPEILGFQGFSPECGYGLINAEKTVKRAIVLNKKRRLTLKTQ